MRLPKGGCGRERLDAGLVLCAGVTASGRALRSCVQARAEPRMGSRDTEEPLPFVTGCGP